MGGVAAAKNKTLKIHFQTDQLLQPDNKVLRTLDLALSPNTGTI